jgi:hypothetical protein
MVVQGDADLLEVVAALHAASGLAGRLHRGQKEGDEDADDGDYDEELY